LARRWDGPLIWHWHFRHSAPRTQRTNRRDDPQFRLESKHVSVM
jgi:hypothetical protein